jgi:hypothetical protein
VVDEDDRCRRPNRLEDRRALAVDSDGAARAEAVTSVTPVASPVNVRLQVAGGGTGVGVGTAHFAFSGCRSQKSCQRIVSASGGGVDVDTAWVTTGWTPSTSTQTIHATSPAGNLSARAARNTRGRLSRGHP